jgi:hypothetical protein
MVSIPERYYILLDNVERGPFTLGQVASMWSSGNLTSNTLYRLTNIESWTPLSQLDDTLRFINSSRPVQESGAKAKEPIPAEQGVESSRLSNMPGALPVHPEFSSGPEAQKYQAMVAKLLLSKDSGGNPEMTAHLENVVTGRPIPAHWLTGDECERQALAFRRKWALLHVGFWFLLGIARIGWLAALGLMFSAVVLVVQLQWKKRQLLSAMGLPRAEVNRRVPGLF